MKSQLPRFWCLFLICQLQKKKKKSKKPQSVRLFLFSQGFNSRNNLIVGGNINIYYWQLPFYGTTKALRQQFQKESTSVGWQWVTPKHWECNSHPNREISKGDLGQLNILKPKAIIAGTSKTQRTKNFLFIFSLIILIQTSVCML